MDFIYPDIEWYTGISEQKGVQPRCPYANVHRCYRYYASLYMLGEASITTKMSHEKIKELESLWHNSDQIPAVAEHDTGISGPGDEKTAFDNFCPEISFDIFGLFSISLHKYSDEIDIDTAHRRLSKEAFPDDWRWSWASVIPLHYLQCPVYSQLLSKQSSSSEPSLANHHGQDVIEVKPGIMGISVNIRSLFTRISKWWLSKHK